jgi:hypothetical protein
MSLEMGRVDHHDLACLALGGQERKNLIENSYPAPPDKAVIQGFGRAIARWSVAPQQAIRITWMIPLMTRRSSTRLTPRILFGRSGLKRSNWISVSQKRCDITMFPHDEIESHRSRYAIAIYMS